MQLFKFRIKPFLEKLIEIVILLIAFLPPVFFAFFYRTNNVFTLNKIVIFKMLVIILFWLTIFRYLIDRKVYKNNIKVLDKFITIPFLLMIVLTVSSIFSIDTYTSLNGLYQRQMGLISHLYYFIFFVLLVLNIKSRRQVRDILLTSVLSSFVASIYGIIQIQGFDPLNWTESTETRATSTFGQPNFLGLFIIMILPVTCYFLQHFKRYFLKVVFLFIFVIQIFCLLYTYSISSYLSLILASISLLFIYFVFFRSKDFKKLQIKHLKKIVIAIFVFLIFFVVFYFIAPNKYQSVILSSKVGKVINLTGGSVSARLQFWQAGIKAIPERFILGHGLDTQKQVLVKNYQKDWALYNNINVMPNRAHNIVIDILLTIGVVGLFIYCAMSFLALKLIILNIRARKEPILNYLILFSLTTYLFYLQFNFSIVVSAIYFWIFLAILIFINQQEAIENIELDSGENSIFKVQRKFYLVIIIVIFSAFSYICTNQIKNLFNVIIADNYFMQLRMDAKYNRYFASVKMYEFIKEYVPQTSYYDFEFARMLSNFVLIYNVDPFYKVGVDKLQEVKQNIKTENYDSDYAITNMQSALIQKYPELKEEVDKNYQNLISYHTEIPFIYKEYAFFLYREGEYEKALDNFEICLDKIPEYKNYNRNVVNDDHRVAIKQEIIYVYQGIGRVYYELGDRDNAVLYFEKALELDPNNPILIDEMEQKGIYQDI